MPDAEAKLKVTIETASTGNAPQQTAAGIKDVTNAAQKAAPALGQVSTQSKNTAQELGKGVEIGNAAVATLTNIASSGQGGAAGLIAITRAGFSAGTMFKGLLASMGPFGIAAAAVGIAVGLISAALRKSEAAAKDAEARITALNKIKLDDAAREQDKYRKAATEALKVLEAEARVKEEIADAELAKRKAAVRADARDTGEDAAVTERKLLNLDRQREDEKRAAALALAQERVSKLAEEEERRAKAAKEASDAYADQQQRLDTLAARERAAASTPETTSAMGMPTANPEYARAQDDLAAARAAADGLSADSVKQQKAAAEALQKAAEEATETANEARAAAELEAKKYRAITPIINDTRTAEDRAKGPQSEAEKAAIEAAKAKREAEIKRTPAALWNNRIASGGVDAGTAAEVAAAFPGYKFAEIPEWRRKQESPAMTPTSMADVQAESEARRKAEEEKRRTSGGIITTPDGRTIPVAAPTAPAPGGGTIMGPNGQIQTFPAGGQPQGPGRGAYREPQTGGSDNKTAEALQGTTEAVKSQDTGDATAKAAEKLQKTAEEQAKLVGESARKTDVAMAGASKALAAASGVLTQQNAKLGQHDTEFRRVWGAISALQSRAA